MMNWLKLSYQFRCADDSLAGASCLYVDGLGRPSYEAIANYNSSNTNRVMSFRMCRDCCGWKIEWRFFG